MTNAVTDTAIDIAYWFYDKALDEKVTLTENKMQHLVFLSQLLYAGAYNKTMLMPSLFICADEGIYEPSLKKILSLGRPYLPQPGFPPKLTAFLEEIWKRYALLPEAETEHFIKNLSIYKENHQKDAKKIIDFKTIVESLNKNSRIETEKSEKRKIMQSQNGPVIVSKWQPKKASEYKK